MNSSSFDPRSATRRPRRDFRATCWMRFPSRSDFTTSKSCRVPASALPCAVPEIPSFRTCRRSPTSRSTMPRARRPARSRCSTQRFSATIAAAGRSSLPFPQGFDERQFEVWYQSQVDLESHDIVGLEALIRWRHPEHGVIGPGEFLPLIERSGNNARLTRYVLTDACRALQHLAAAGRPHIRIAINLPPSELADHSFAAELRATCARFDVAASLLELEITEGSLINNMANASET